MCLADIRDISGDRPGPQGTAARTSLQLVTDQGAELEGITGMEVPGKILEDHEDIPAGGQGDDQDGQASAGTGQGCGVGLAVLCLAAALISG